VTFDAAMRMLQVALAQPLPGADAQALMAPRPRRAWPQGSDPARVRQAAGLLLLFPLEGRAHIVLTVRADALGRHGGQVSLPGGVTEPGETFEEAALREAHEEVALSPAGVRVLGALTPLDIPVSGFRLHPIVAAVDERPGLKPSDGEVARILEVSLAQLTDPSTKRAVSRMRDGQEFTVPVFQIDGVEVWGATAMVLAEFLVLLGWTPDPA
jgi:8-oxo-dGTP pyrophosphatase MutT (NUDIX family)